MAGEFHPQSSAELFHRRLGHGVGKGAHPVGEREHRTDQGELAALGDDLIHCGLNGVDHTGDVHREQGLDRGGRCGPQRPGAGQDARIGDGDVEAPEATHDGVDGSIEALAVTDVGDHPHGRGRRHRGADPRCRGIEVGDGGFGAAAQEFLCSGAADPAGSPGDHDDFVTQVVVRAAHRMPRLGRNDTVPLRRSMATVVASRPRSRSGCLPAPRRWI